MLVKTDKGGGK